jgi:hypothetical protein
MIARPSGALRLLGNEVPEWSTALDVLEVCEPATLPANMRCQSLPDSAKLVLVTPRSVRGLGMHDSQALSSRAPDHMHIRTLGQRGLTVSALGYGSIGISSPYGPATTGKASPPSNASTAWA